VDLNHYATLQLAEGDGPRIVYARFKDTRGFMTLPVHTGVLVDTTPPVLDLLLNHGSYLATTTEITVHVSYEDVLPAGEMWISEGYDLAMARPMEYSRAFDWVIPADEGVHTLSVWVADVLGNMGRASASVYYATQPPVCQVFIEGGRYSNATDPLEVRVEAVDHYNQTVEVQLSFGEEPADGTPWRAIEEPLFLQVPPGTTDGTYDVFVRGRSSIGLVGQVASASVVIDRTPPEVEVLSPKDGHRYESAEAVVDLRVESSDESGVTSAHYIIAGEEWTEFDPQAGAVRLKLPDMGDHRVYVRVVDRAGNEEMVEVSFTVESEPDTAWLSAPVVMFLLLMVLLALYLVWREMRNRE
jgi:hypothetical protein